MVQSYSFQRPKSFEGGDSSNMNVLNATELYT